MGMPPVNEQLRFDSLAGEAAAATGMQRAESAERAKDWRRDASAWLDGITVGTEITADDLVRAVGLPDEGKDKNNSVGAWFNSQAVLGYIRFAGRYTHSDRVIRHGNLIRVWRRV